MGALIGLNPQEVFGFFENISAIPRCSKNEMAISNYLVKFAEQRRLTVFQDRAFNVIIKKPGSKGRENESALILQGHLDMVGEKTPDSQHDFLTDALVLKHNNERIFADGTTLGADNGIAIAMIMALLDDKDAVHPPIEAVLTTGEEDALDGANALDYSKLNGRRMINLDSEEEGSFIVGCAGGCVTEIKFEASPMELIGSCEFFEIRVKGLLGGHSGVDIDKERGNANIILGRVLNTLLPLGVQLISVEGGSRDNVIPHSAYTLIAVTSEIKAELIMEVERLNSVLRNEYCNSDQNVELSLTSIPVIAQKKAFHEGGALTLSRLLMILPCNVLHVSTDIKGLVETSNSVAILHTIHENDKIIVSIINSTRSSVASRKALIEEKIKAIAALCNAETSSYDYYPSWEYSKDSPLRDVAAYAWKRVTGRDAEITTTHGGLECGIFASKIPGLDIISFGPNIFSVHSPSESLEIASVKRIWEFLIELLKEI
jgi:dipeptidase D